MPTIRELKVDFFAAFEGLAAKKGHKHIAITSRLANWRILRLLQSTFFNCTQPNRAVAFVSRFMQLSDNLGLWDLKPPQLFYFILELSSELWGINLYALGLDGAHFGLISSRWVAVLKEFIGDGVQHFIPIL